jgi:hypothetical protein
VRAWARTNRFVNLVGATMDDAVSIMIEGESGILECCPNPERPRYIANKRMLRWPNGSKSLVFSADEPDRLRGKQHMKLCSDEVASWRYPEAWDQAVFGLRLGARPQACITTTPRARQFFRDLLKHPDTVVVRGSSDENRANLPAAFYDSLVARYRGTRLGRQELEGELIEIVDGAVYPMFSRARHVTPEAEYVPGLPVYVAVDAGVSRVTAAVLFHARQVGTYEWRFDYFGEVLVQDLYAAAAALAIGRELEARTGGHFDMIFVDPASSARTGIGPAARAEYELAFGARKVTPWPLRPVLDGIDAVSMLLDKGQIRINPRCLGLIDAFPSYARRKVGGEWSDLPEEIHPVEDYMDAVRGSVMAILPEGRTPRPHLTHVPATHVF